MSGLWNEPETPTRVMLDAATFSATIVNALRSPFVTSVPRSQLQFFLDILNETYAGMGLPLATRLLQRLLAQSLQQLHIARG